MRLRLKVLLLSLAVSLFLATGLAYAVLHNSFHTSLTAELNQGVHNSGMLAASLQTGIEAFSHLSKGDATARAIRLTAGYMTEPALITVASPQGQLLHDNFPLDQSPLLHHIPAASGSYLVVNHQDIPWQLLSRSIATTQGNFQLVYARSLQPVYQAAQEQSWQAVLLLLALCLLLLVVLLFALRAVFSPLQQLEKAAKRIAGGRYQTRARVVHPGDEVGQLAQAFNHMADATQEHIENLQQKDQAQQQFIADMAHELKTPLTSMIGFADLLQRHQLPEDKRQEALESIVSQGERLERMGLKLLHLAQLQGGIVPDIKPLHIQPLFKEVADALAHLAREKGMAIKVHKEDAVFPLDRDLVLTMLQNLLTNALDASQAGQVVHLRATKEGFAVLDEGHGIPAEHLPHVTEAFYMADKSRSRARHGAGLGLALASRIAALHSARLVIQSQPGQGTAVLVLFSPEQPDCYKLVTGTEQGLHKQGAQ